MLMCCLRKCLLCCAILALVTAILVALAWNYDVTPPEITRDGWWGVGPRTPKTGEDKKIRKFVVDVSNSTLKDLRQRLSMARFKKDLEEERTAHYGMRSEYMLDVIQYWQSKYDWRKHEKILNSFDQFTTRIEGIDVHFIHIKPKATATVPLLMVHGWPGSVWEFYKIIPMLTDPKNPVVFELICPSIPGYGFSEAPHKTGFDQGDAARVFHKLMLRLGHSQFYVQGGDWGAAIVSLLSLAYPESVLGIHVNMPLIPNTPRAILKEIFGALAPVTVYGSQKEADKLIPFLPKLFGLIEESGYMHIQATKPDTIGMGLNDSPLALASYILEKFGTWTDLAYRDLPDGGMTKKFTLDELLTNVMIYWVNENIASSQRFYKEFFNSEEVLALLNVGVTAPAGVSCFPGELIQVPKILAEEAYRNLVQYTDMPRGGHFAAFEEPRLLADDVISFVQKVQQLKITKEAKKEL